MSRRSKERSIARSLALYERRPRRAGRHAARQPAAGDLCAGVAPLFAERGRGSRLWDVDGGEYIDYGMSVSACILGYADDAVDRAVIERIRSGGVMYSLNHPAEIELAERLTRTIPCAEMVRFAKGGGEACAIAVRIARGFSGREKVLFCGYHGWHDWYLAANLAGDDSLDDHLLPAIEPTGVPRALAGTAIPFPYGDLAALEDALARHRGDVAAIITEPLRSDAPPANYLQGVKQLAAAHGVVLIFDEVSTGFRHDHRGVEAFVGVTPDMAVLAKSLANGYPMGAVVGSRQVMEPAARMFISSTNWSELVGIAAALATLEEIKRRDVPARLAEFGRQLIDGFNELALELQVDARMVGLPAAPRIEFGTPDERSEPRQLLALYGQEMARRGVLINAHPRHSAAHGERDLTETLAASREALAIIRDSVQSGTIDERLEVSLQPLVFRRLVD